MISFGVESSMRVESSLRGKAAEHHRMDCAKPGAGEHRKQSLRHHRHVDDNTVALANAEIAERCGNGRQSQPALR